MELEEDQEEEEEEEEEDQEEDRVKKEEDRSVRCASSCLDLKWFPWSTVSSELAILLEILRSPPLLLRMGNHPLFLHHRHYCYLLWGLLVRDLDLLQWTSSILVLI